MRGYLMSAIICRTSPSDTLARYPYAADNQTYSSYI